MVFDGPWGRRGATLMQRRHAIIAVNHKAMQEEAFLSVYPEVSKHPKQKILRGVMAVFDMQIHSEAMDKRPPMAEDLKDRVCLALECSRPTAFKFIDKTVDLGILSRRRDGVHVQTFFDVAQSSQARKVLSFYEIIPDVVSAQLKDVFNANAGRELLPREVYYNVVASYDEKKDEGK